MKIIYLKNEGGHKKGDMKEVAEGYFMNFLSPKGLALPATKENIARVKKELENKTKVLTVNTRESEKVAKSIAGRKVEIKAKANEAGKLYAAVSGDEVLAVLSKQGAKVNDAKVIFASHIKEPGNYKVKVDFGHGILSEINVVVRV